MLTKSESQQVRNRGVDGSPRSIRLIERCYVEAALGRETPPPASYPFNKPGNLLRLGEKRGKTRSSL